MYLSVIVGYLTCLVLVFDAVRVAVFIVYHFVLFCKPGAQNNLLFLNDKQNSNFTKNCLCTSDEFGCEKIVRFRQHSNSSSNSGHTHSVAVSIHSSLCFHRHGMPNLDIDLHQQISFDCCMQ